MDYYTWRLRKTAIRGRNFTVYFKPGMLSFKELDAAGTLLAEHIKITSASQALILNSGDGLVGAVAASLAEAGSVFLTDTNSVAYEASQKTIAANGLAHVQTYLSNGASHFTLDAPVDLVTLRLPQGKLPSLQLIWDAFNALKVGGRFYMAGANNEGIKTYLKYAEALFGSMPTIAYRKGHRVGLGIKEKNLSAIPQPFQDDLLNHHKFHEFTAKVKGKSYPVYSRPGVFSWNELDAGTRVLIESMGIGAADQVLDLGCGYGLVGVVAAALASRGAVYLVDSDIEAVEAAKRTVRANQLTNCEVRVSDCAAAVKGLSFDVVVTNPPFHVAKATHYDMALQFIEDAFIVLKPGGRLYLVANRFIPYESHIQQKFQTVRAIYEDPRFKVIEATK